MAMVESSLAYARLFYCFYLEFGRAVFGGRPSPRLKQGSATCSGRPGPRCDLEAGNRPRREASAVRFGKWSRSAHSPLGLAGLVPVDRAV